MIKILRFSKSRRLFNQRLFMKFLTQKEARDIDIELMGPKQGFVVEQLMELAGLSKFIFLK